MKPVRYRLLAVLAIGRGLTRRAGRRVGDTAPSIRVSA